MLEEATAEVPAVQLTMRRRVRHGLGRRRNWFQLVRFAAVGASGYVVNLATYTVCLHAFGLHYLAAGTLAFVVAVTKTTSPGTVTGRSTPATATPASRRRASSRSAWRVPVQPGDARAAGRRGSWERTKVLAQAIAIVTATPLNFLGNKLWSFRS